MKKVYLAGPMSGIPQFNIPAFDTAAAALRAQGYEVVSPAELDSEAVREAGLNSPDGYMHDGRIAGETWGEILARDVKVVADDVDGIVFLPNWHKSRGARLEAFVALLSGKQHFYSYFGQAAPSIAPLPIDTVRGIIQRNMP